MSRPKEKALLRYTRSDPPDADPIADFDCRTFVLTHIPAWLSIVVQLDEFPRQRVELWLLLAAGADALAEELPDVHNGHDQEVDSTDACFLDGNP